MMKKKFLLIAGLLFTALTGFSQQYLNEDFSSGYFPNDWRYSPDTTDAAMNVETVASEIDGVTKNIPCVSYQQYAEKLPNGVWWITPKLNVTSDEDSIVFWFKNEDAIGLGSCDKFSVLVSVTDNEFASFDKNNPLFVKHYNDIYDGGDLLKTDIAKVACDEELIRYAISLEDYIGEQIYIAFHVDLGVVMYGDPEDYFDPYNSVCTYYLADVKGPQIYAPSSCPKTDGLNVYAISSTSATMSWHDIGDGENKFTLQYMKASLTDWNQAITVADIYDTVYTAELEPATTYKYRVATQCGDEMSDYTNAKTFSTLSNTVVELPWIRTFEEDGNFDEFTFYSTSEFNQWTIGEAAGYGTEDSKHSLYVSSDGGVTNTYSDDTTVAWAAVRIHFPEGKEEFNLSYQYRVKGSGQVWGQWDYLTVYMIPDNLDIVLDSIPAYATKIQPRTYSHEYWDPWKVKLSGDFAGTTQKLVFLWNNDNSGSYQPAAAIDNISLTYADCVTPSDLQVTDIKGANAVLKWSASQNASSWYVYYKEENAQDYDSVLAEDTVFVFTDELETEKNYSVFVRTECADTLSDASNTVTFNTSCGNITSLPYVEDFESYGVQSTKAFPSCWYRAAVYSLMWDYPSCLTNGASTTGAFLSLMTQQGDTNIFATARVADTIDIKKLKVSFIYQTKFIGMPLVVGVMSDPLDASTFVAVDSVKSTKNLQWENMEVYLDNYNGEGKYIAFWFGDPYTAESFPSASIDNLVIDYGQSDVPCSMKPAKISVSNITDNNAIVNWRENTPVTSWYVYYKQHGSDAEFDSLDTESIPFSFNNILSEATSYDVFVKSNCGEQGMPSSDTVTFTTICKDITELEYTEDFESYEEFPTCWYRTKTQEITDYYTYTKSVYPRISVVGHGDNTTKALAFENGWDGINAASIHRLGDDIEIQEVKLSFEYYSADKNAIIVGVLDDPYDINTFVAVDTVSIISTGWESKEVFFNNYEGQGRHIAFVMAEQLGAGAIDNVVLEEFDPNAPCVFAPSAVAVKEITSESAVVTWNSNSTAEKWYLYYKKSSDNMFDSVLVLDSSYTLETELEPSTSYDIYVKSECNEEIMSPASSMVTFMTACTDIVTLPYTEDFEDPAYSEIPTCWYSVESYEMMAGFNYPRILGNSQGSYISFMGIDGDEKMAVACPRINESLGSLSTMQVSFKVYDYDMGDEPAPVVVGIMTDPGDVSTFVALDTITVDARVWVDTTVTFESYNGDGRYVAFFAGFPYNAGYNGMISVDDVVINVIGSSNPFDSQYDTIRQEICANETYTFNGQALNESGEYNDTVKDAQGKIIITTLVLTVNPLLTDTVNATTCSNVPYLFGDKELTVSGTYTREIENEGTCDSLIVLNLTVNPAYDTTVNAEINEGETYTGYGFSETAAGTYVHNEKTAEGCDSVVTLNLTVKSSIAEITNNGDIIIYPNPVKDNATLSLTGMAEVNYIIVTDNQGRTVRRYESSQIKDGGIEINTDGMSAGVYYVTVNTTDKIITKKLIKK